MSSGVLKRATGSVVGTGAAIDIDTPGFKPRQVTLRNVDGVAKGYWQDSMPDAAMWVEADSGAGAVDFSYVTSDGITPRTNGFRIGANTDVNVAAEVIHWEAEE